MPVSQECLETRTQEFNMSASFSGAKMLWIFARRTTDRDLESQRHEKVNAWICARPTTAIIFQVSFRTGKRETEKSLIV